MFYTRTNLRVLLYASRKHPAFYDEAVQFMMLKSKRMNRLRGITGCLLYYKGCFLQYLEGEQGQISALKESLRGDVRHQQLQFFLDRKQDARLFQNFSIDFHDFRADHRTMDHKLEVLKGFYEEAHQVPSNRKVLQMLLYKTSQLLERKASLFHPVTAMPGHQERELLRFLSRS